MVTRKSVSWVSYLFLGTFGVLMAFPFFWMISSSLKPASDILAFPPTLLPLRPTLLNYAKAVSKLNIPVLYRNSVLITAAYTVLTVFIGSILGYQFGKFEFKGKSAIFVVLLGTLVVPKDVYVIPLYLLMNSLGLIDTFLSVIIPFAFSAYGVFLVRQYVHSIPDDLISAARVDGYGETRIFFHIVLPLMKPALSALAIFYLLYQWNDFFWPLVMLNSPDKFTLAIGLANFVGEHFADYGTSLAGAAFSIVPMLIAFLLLQKYIMAGIALTGLKG